MLPAASVQLTIAAGTSVRLSNAAWQNDFPQENVLCLFRARYPHETHFSSLIRLVLGTALLCTTAPVLAADPPKLSPAAEALPGSGPGNARVQRCK